MHVLVSMHCGLLCRQHSDPLAHMQVRMGRSAYNSIVCLTLQPCCTWCCAYPMHISTLSYCFDQPQMQALCSEEEAFTDEVIAGARPRGTPRRAGAPPWTRTSPRRSRAGGSSPSLVAARSPFMGRPAILHVGLLFFGIHVQLCCVFKVYSLVICYISASSTHS